MNYETAFERVARRTIDIGAAMAGLAVVQPLVALRRGAAHANRSLPPLPQRRSISNSLRSLLRGELSLVGPTTAVNEHEGESVNFRPGLLTLHGLRERVNIAYGSPAVSDSEYLLSRSLTHDAKLVARFLPSLLWARGGDAKGPMREILGVKLSNLSMKEAVAKLIDFARGGESKTVYFINPHCVNIAVSNRDYRAALDRADLRLPDGIGLQVAAELRGETLGENVNGTDLYPCLIDRAAQEGVSLFLLGATVGVAEEMARRARALHPELRIVGCQHGFYQRDGLEDADVIARINALRPDIVLVALGVPRQELWIDGHRRAIKAPLVLGVGGLFDFYSGSTPRAPQWLREIGLEWAYRLRQEPRRLFHRYVIGNPVFLSRVIAESVRQRRSANVQSPLDYFETIDYRTARWQLLLKIVLKRGIWRAVAGASRASKRLLDIAGSGAGLLALAPLFGATAMALKLEGPGPVFFSQIRVGREGRTFTMWKFRSMVANAEKSKDALAGTNESEAGVTFKMKRDPRVTLVGRLIRKLSIDELPQLYNVLLGDMTLVGPRPPVPKEVDEYYLHERRRLDVEPGLTCLWQVGGRSDIDFDGQVRLDLEYIESRSVRTDIQILLRTVPAVLTGRGAY